MKGFTRDHKFVPMTDYKKVTRKSRDPKAKTQGVRLKRTTRVKALTLVPTELLNHPMFEEGSEWLDILAENPKVIVPDEKQRRFWIWFGGESRNFHEVQPDGHTADTFSYGGDRATENITPKEAVRIIEELELNPEEIRRKRDPESNKKIIDKLRGKEGVSAKVEREYDEDDPDEFEDIVIVKITKQKTFDSIGNGGTALEISMRATGLTEIESQKTLESNGIFELEKEGKIKRKNGKWIKV